MLSENSDYFEFVEKNELPEQQSSHMKQCPHCLKPIPEDSILCLYCGEAISKRTKNKWAVLIVIFVLVAFLIWILI